MNKRLNIIAAAVLAISVILLSTYVLVRATKRDNVPPQITMQENSISVSVNAPETEILSGVTAFDKQDGDITSQLVIEELSNFVAPSRRIASIAVCDSSNNVTRAKREVIYTDYKPPEFDLTAPLMFAEGDTLNTKQVVVRDVLDGDLSQDVRVLSLESASVYAVGEHPMSFTVANSAGEVISVPMTLEVYNRIPGNVYPEFALSEYLVTIPANSSFDPWQYLVSVRLNGVLYQKDGDQRLVGESVSGEQLILKAPDFQILHDVDTQNLGVYEVVYQVTVNGEYTGKTRLVVIVQ